MPGAVQYGARLPIRHTWFLGRHGRPGWPLRDSVPIPTDALPECRLCERNLQMTYRWARGKRHGVGSRSAGSFQFPAERLDAGGGRLAERGMQCLPAALVDRECLAVMSERTVDEHQP